MSNILQQVQIPVIENAECKEKYLNVRPHLKLPELRFHEAYVLCAGFAVGGKDACLGDSGGPLMIPIHEYGRFQFYQIGIVSYALGCGRPNIPGVYVNVQKFAHWIEEKLQ